jgi:heme A synthase
MAATQQAADVQPSGSPRLYRRLDRLRVAMIAALAVQLCLGVANNLWLSQPRPNLDKASPQSLLSAHTTMAYVIIALAVWILVDAIRVKRRGYLVPACTGIAGVLLAYASGLTYYATESNVWSMLMTIGFTIAVTSYALAGRRWPGR